MHPNRKTIAVLVLVLCAVTVNPAVLAQGDNLTAYQNDVFSIAVPDMLEVQEEGTDRAVFAGGGSSIEVMPVALSPQTHALLQEFGDDLESNFLLVMELAFAGSDYEIAACSDLVNLPCVEFADQPTWHRMNVYDAGSGAFYAVTFRAQDESGMDELRCDEVISSFAFVQPVTAAGGEDTMFNVVANGNVNLRSCAATTCDIVGQATGGQVLSVIGQDKDWYQVEWESGTAYIASWLTARGPDVYVDLTERYTDPKTGCTALLRLGRGDANLSIAIAGDRQRAVWVDIYRPNESKPQDVFGQYDKTFIDTEEPYIHQVYWTWWPTGRYQLELTLDSQSSMIAFDISESGGHTLFVDCN